MKKFVTVGIGVVILVSLAVAVVTAAPGADGTLNTYFVPSTYTASLGETFSMDLWADASATLRVQGMSANITFDPNFLEVTVFEDGCLGTHFDSFDNVAGTIAINASILGPNLQESPCAVKNIQFTVKADAPGGVTTIAFTDACIAAGPGPDCYTTVTEDGTVVVPVPQTLTVIVDPEGSGTVNRDDPGPYETMDVVELDPVPAAHYWSFVNWSGDLTGSDDPATITMTKDMTVTANFTAATTHTVDVGDSVPPGGGTVDVDEQWDDDVYEDGETITVTATAAHCYKFAGWTGDLAGEPNPAVVPVGSDMTFAATFTVMTSTLSVNVAPVGADARVDITPDQTVFECGATVTATAVATDPWSFDQWSGALTSDVSPDSFVIGEDAATVLTGNFVSVYIVTIPPTDTIDGGGYDVDYDPTECTPVTGGYECDPDSVITFTAQADHCYEFAGWLGDIGGVPTMTNPLALTVVANVEITPTFTVIQYDTLTVVVDPAGKGTAVVDPASGPYICGQTTVTATATPTTTWAFNRWSGAVDSTDNPVVFTMGEEDTLTAHFAQYMIYLPVVMRNF